MSLILFTRRCCEEEPGMFPAAIAAAVAIDEDEDMGTGALTRFCCCCDGSIAGGPLVGGGGGMKKDPIGAYPSLLLYEGVGDVDDLLKLNTFDSEFCKEELGSMLETVLMYRELEW